MEIVIVVAALWIGGGVFAFVKGHHEGLLEDGVETALFATVCVLAAPAVLLLMARDYLRGRR